VNVLAAEKRREEAERAMASGDFRRARIIASETVVLASEAAQSQDVATAMSQIKLAEETLEELRALGLDASEWDRTVNRSREFLKKLDFKSAEETARWVRQKAREEARMYRQALLTLDHCNSVITTYKDMGLVVRKAEDLKDEARAKLREGDPELALNLAKKAEKMVREISERQKGAQAALKKASNLVRAERRSGKDVTKSEKLYDLAQHQLELGEYANAMKLANKSVEALSASGAAVLELCPTCGEAIPENAPECPSCAERNRRREREQAPAPKEELAQRTRLGVKGGRKYACPYCGDLFEITVPRRPITIACPWCGYEVSVVE
jgi:tetratricopeptide (TPR) repeat protein